MLYVCRRLRREVDTLRTSDRHMKDEVASLRQQVAEMQELMLRYIEQRTQQVSLIVCVLIRSHLF